MKKLSLILAIVMVMSCLSGAFAEGTVSAAEVMDVRAQEVDAEAAAAEEARLKSDCAFSVIEADETTGQKKLSYMEGVTTILEVDGLKFKDLNKNGTLDVYEDWRVDTDARIADLISQMTPEEEVGLLFCVNTQLADAAQMVREYALTCQLFNLNGTPITITNTLNNLQADAEAERLGVPMVFTSDREYNSFGGYIDKAHEGFGTANDPELAYELACFYGKAMRAVGIHVTFEPYAEEIGAQYGENPEYIAAIAHEEIRGLEENGLASCTKHWIGRGGDSSFGKARSVAQNFENWMVGWKAALSAGSEWVMTNCGGTGITNTVDVKWDKVTMDYLRKEIGFDGVVVTDWWALGGGPNNPGRMTGITPEGIDLGQQTIAWLYNKALEYGTDMFGSGSMIRDYSNWEQSPSSNYPQAIIDGLASGEVDKANVDQAATRILRFKYNKDLFENPYCDVAAAVELCASAEWAANPTEITNDEELRAARNPYEVELTEKLQAKSAVLVKNDNNLLPLSKDAKVYVEASSKDAAEAYKKYFAEKGATIVDEMEDADVVVGDFGTINDATELFIEDAQDAGKPIVLTLNCTKPTQYAIESADALLYMSYSQGADHGSTEGGFITGTAPWVYADMIFGDREPGGVINKEIARDTVADNEQWKDLAGDQGASPYVRLMVQAVMEDDPNHASPSNWGDPLVTYQFGMSYGKDPEFKYSCLILPLAQETVEVESGSSTWTESRAKEYVNNYETKIVENSAAALVTGGAAAVAYDPAVYNPSENGVDLSLLNVGGAHGFTVDEIFGGQSGEKPSGKPSSGKPEGKTDANSQATKKPTGKSGSSSLIDTILNVGTTQAFVDEAVPVDDLKTILQAGLSAPSAINQQPWYFVAVTNQEIMNEIAGTSGASAAAAPAAAGDGFSASDGNSFTPSDGGSFSPSEGGSAMPVASGSAKAGLGDSPAAIIIYRNDGTSSPNADFDCGLATQNMVIAAAALGYGVKIVSSPTMTLNGANHDAICEKLGVDKSLQAVAVLLIGRADTDAVTSATTRETLDTRTTIIE